MKDASRLVAPLGGKFQFKRNPDGTIDRQKVICIYCRKEFSFHRSNSSLKYHINAKHRSVSDSDSTSANASPSVPQTTFMEHQHPNPTKVELNDDGNNATLEKYIKEEEGEEEEGEEESPTEPEAHPEAPTTTEELNSNSVGDITMRWLHKRKLELDIEHKKLQIKIAKVELEKLELEKMEWERWNCNGY
ncbi:zinc finger protein 687b-like isoform X2 [Salarias fasciatus]|uniref:zinc finger protein 687b-like isoform X2 n=1 Tax=Salarias fasciatus TaxID=181472 RepID=UPI0011769400|nr:zinc finger protein 687b-like isoform X2 [Salarias fasciatus]